MQLAELLTDIRACRVCEAHLPLGPRPIVAAKPGARIILAGQAPGTRVHETGIPWNDRSGDRLRDWLEMDREIFYDASKLAIIPMGFCYPGTGDRGDLPPRPECAPLWHERLLALLPEVKLTLAIGQYAIKYYLGKSRKKTLAETVKHWHTYIDQGVIPLGHPSPRNIRWRQQNPWYEAEAIPAIRRKVWEVLGEE